MKRRITFLVALGLAALLMNSVQAQTDPGLQAIIDLSHINGQALACQDMKAASRAKNLMLLHSPKTARYGSAFDEGTHQAFLSQIRNTAPCPDTTALFVQLEALAVKLTATLPAALPTTGVQ